MVEGWGEGNGDWIRDYVCNAPVFFFFPPQSRDFLFGNYSVYSFSCVRFNFPITG